LERERDALRHELERSEARIEALEKTQAQVRDRLAWALDSLQNIIQGKG
jgi:chaperonin cofactor prefoldin